MNDALIERFWSKVDKRGQDECWSWLAAKTARGGGSFFDGRSMVSARRFGWVLHAGPIATWLSVTCRCPDSSCVNPAHLALIKGRKPGLAVAQRFAAKVDRNGPMHCVLGSRCWLWTAHLDAKGYGRIGETRDGRPRMALAHRVSWELTNGPIPPGAHYGTTLVCHRCDNPPCVNPSHLFKGDAQMNSDDKLRKKRHRYGVSKGAAHGCAILTEEQAKEIKASALSHKACAEQFGVSYQTVWEIRKGVSWKHL